jgi:CubicO group peptidase (beta-lactamase class C family)
MKGNVRLFGLAAAGCLLASGLGPVAARDLPTIDPAEAGLSKDGLARLDAGAVAVTEKHGIPGGVVLIARKGGVAHFTSFGVSDRDTQRPMRKDDIFRIYSMTKPVVSIALLTLYEEGKFQLNDPLEDYIPGFKNLKVYAGVDANGNMVLEDPKRKPTVLDAFRHTTCIGAGGGPEPVAKLYFDRKIWVSRMESLTEEMELIADVPLLCQPGEAWVYGYDHDVQAYLVEHFSGMPLDQYLQQRIFGPLEMHDTGFGVPDEKRDRVVRVHDISEETPAYPAVDMRPSTYERFAQHPFGTLGLWSTASDFARLSQALLNGGELDGVRILGRKTIELMASNHLPPEVDTLGPAQGAYGTGYGLGVSVMLDPVRDGVLSSVGAYGWDGAATTRFIVDPEEEMVVILMTQKAPFNERALNELQTLVYQSIGR